jgi:hypothetical protein
MIAFFFIVYLLDYILTPNSIVYLGVLFGLIYSFFGYLEPILE